MHCPLVLKSKVYIGEKKKKKTEKVIQSLWVPSLRVKSQMLFLYIHFQFFMKTQQWNHLAVTRLDPKVKEKVKK